jgi:4-amino-4-deoxy-L-arabinose transferase-like glycosyltransferase
MLERLATIPASFFTPDGERLNRHAYLFLLLLCLTFFVPGLATLPPTDRDESLFAQASKQMIENGNVVDIRFQDQPRYKKPIGIYWLQAASVRLLDPHHLNEIWAYRVPSLLGATLAVLMTAGLGTLLFGPGAGLLAAIMMADCLILNVEARLAKTDAALLGSIMVAQYALARAYIGYGQTKIGGGLWFAFWTALGAGILLKGPIILLIVIATLLWLRVTEKNLRWFAVLKPLIGIPYLLLLVAPWFAAIMLASKGQFLEQSAGHDLLGKLWQDQGRGFLPPGLYLLAFPISFFPFSLWAMMAAPDSWINRREPSVRFCLGWIIPAWIAFELALAKLPHYVMPLYPAIAMLAAKFMLDGFPTLAERRFRWLPPLAITLWLMAGTGVVLLVSIVPYLLDRSWNTGMIAGGLLLLIAQTAGLFFFFRQRETGVIIMGAGSLIFMTGLFAATLPALKPLWVSSQIAWTADVLKPCAGPLQISSTYNEPSLVFLAGTATSLRTEGRAVAEDMQKDACRVGVVDDKNRTDFLGAFASASMPPLAVTTIQGIDPGRSRPVEVTLYVLPTAGSSP